MWWRQHFTTDTLIVVLAFLIVFLHYVALGSGIWFGLYFLWMLFDASVYYFVGFLCLCYLCLTCYFIASDANPN